MSIQSSSENHDQSQMIEVGDLFKIRQVGSNTFNVFRIVEIYLVPEEPGCYRFIVSFLTNQNKFSVIFRDGQYSIEGFDGKIDAVISKFETSGFPFGIPQIDLHILKHLSPRAFITISRCNSYLWGVSQTESLWSDLWTTYYQDAPLSKFDELELKST
jgi:hypothetical protein